jgi:hypothetical protein
METITQLDEEQTITIRKPDAATHFPPQYHQLMSGAAFSASSRLFDLNGEAKRARQRQNRAIIAAEVGRFAHVIHGWSSRYTQPSRPPHSSGSPTRRHAAHAIHSSPSRPWTFLWPPRQCPDRSRSWTEWRICGSRMHCRARGGGGRGGLGGGGFGLLDLLRLIQKL